MWMTFGSGFTLLIKRLKRFQKLVGEGWVTGSLQPRPPRVRRGRPASRTRLQRQEHPGEGLQGWGVQTDAASNSPIQPPQAALPTHWIMSSSFSTLAKVATLFLSRYKCPGPPCQRL